MNRLDEIEARANAATDGPWTHAPWGGQNQNGDYSGGNVFDADGEYVVSDVSDVDGALIAHARTDVPALVAALRAVLVEVDGIEGLATEHGRLDFDPSHKAMATAYSLSARGLRAAITSALEES